jgi:mannosyltransferase OCH1-like enzyme
MLSFVSAPVASQRTGLAVHRGHDAARSAQQVRSTAPAIPLVAHFIWLGAELPYTHVLSIRSACRRGGFDEVVLHHERALTRSHAFRSVSQDPRVRCREITNELFTPCPDGDALRALYGALDKPAARANILRIAILYAEGGVYLDTDTVTIRSFAPLCSRHEAFCGAEHIVYPASVKASRNPLVRGAAALRSGLRSVFSNVPGGYRAFRAVSGIYPRAVNNAVLGAAPAHPLLTAMMKEMLATPEAQRSARYALGTHLLQRMVARHPNDIHVCPPDFFYPLGPEISVHWFRQVPRPRLERVLSEHTVCVHWYASVKTDHVVPKIDPAYVREHADRQLYAALVSELAEPTP